MLWVPSVTLANPPGPPALPRKCPGVQGQGQHGSPDLGLGLRQMRMALSQRALGDVALDSSLVCQTREGRVHTSELWGAVESLGGSSYPTGHTDWLSDQE